MKLALLGYGKMGRTTARIAGARGHTLVSIDPQIAEAAARSITPEILQDIDVAIDFTNPKVVLDNIRAVLALRKNLVVGTTGWYDSLTEVRKLAEAAGTGFLYAPNFSLGVNLFYNIVRHAARLMNKFDAYDVAAVELHHRRKADSPSGTAYNLAEVLRSEIRRKELPVYDKLDRPLKPGELHVASVRCGNFPGTHEVIFDSEADTITLQHCNRNQDGLALGAVLAAEWLTGKRGFFTMDDVLRDLITN